MSLEIIRKEVRKIDADFKVSYHTKDDMFSFVEPHRAEVISIRKEFFDDDKEIFVGKEFDITAETLRYDDIISLLRKDTTFILFAETLNRILKALQMKGEAYRTHYGICIYAIFANEKELNDYFARLETSVFLKNKIDVRYLNSTQRFVSRIRILKTKENLQKVSDFVNKYKVTKVTK